MWWHGAADREPQADEPGNTVTETSPLQAELKKLIASSGPMPVWRYMELCLTHPRHGYYVSRDPLGREGDFTTAPEVSQMFGELLGLWAASVWRAMDSPPALQLIELGPGRGTMMADALRALRVLPPLYQALSIHLVEINPVLREKQQATLSGVRNIIWHDHIDEVPPGPSVILANEYFDVLPMHQMVKRETGWHERTVEIDADGKLAFGASAEPMPRFEVLLPPLVRAAPVGAVFEWRPDTEIMKIATRVRDDGGAALIIDYGHLRSDAGDTFQAIARHSFADPLKNPGPGRRHRACRFPGAGARRRGYRRARARPGVAGRIPQALGIEQRAATLMAKTTPEVSEDISGALKRLTDGGRGGMGSMFKVLAISDPALDALAGFADDDIKAADAMMLGSPLLSAIPGLRHALLHPRGRRVRRHLPEPQWRHRLAGRSRACRGKPPAHGGAVGRRAGAFSHRLSGSFARCRDRDRAMGRRVAAACRCHRDAHAGLAIGVTAADCGPVLFADPHARVIGAAHAGWKGALTGVLESTVAAMEKLGAERGGIVAAIGPLIRQHSYEVGAEFVERFTLADADNARFFIAVGARRPRDVRSRRLHPDAAGKRRRADDRRSRHRHLFRRALLQLPPLGASQRAGLRPAYPRDRAGG